MIFFHILGVVGTVCVLFCYWMIAEGKWTNKTKKYYLINGIGALFLLASLVVNFNLGSVILEIFFLIITVRGYLKAIKENNV